MTFEVKGKHAQQVAMRLGTPPLTSLGVSRHIYIHPAAQALVAATAAHCSEANPALPARSSRKKKKEMRGKKNLGFFH